MDLSPIWLVVAGLALLLGGGELLVRGAVRLANSLGVSPLVIGLTVVSFGTSAPELAVGVAAARAGNGALALGNVLGSNICNVLLVLGMSAVVAPLLVARRVVRFEVPLVVAVSALTLLMAANGQLSPIEGAVLVLIVIAYTGWLWRSATTEGQGEVVPEAARGGRWLATIAILAGLVLLVAGARQLVAGASALAAALGVADEVIGLTIVAVGTSLPEVVASLVATARGQRDIAVGNVLGSNIFNLTAILGPTVVAGGGIAVPSGLLTFDFVVALAVAAACLPVFYTGHRIDRWEGLLFLVYYVVYVVYLVFDATGHAALQGLRDALVYFALPLTAVTLLMAASRAFGRARYRTYNR